MIVVTGATGNVGRPLVRALVAAGEQVTAVSRGISAPDKAAGVRHQQADLAEPDSLKPALDGAEALFLLTSGDWVSAGGNSSVILDILDVARAGGVRRVILLSSQGVGTRRHPPELEDAVKQAGLEWTVLRPGGFDSNTFLWAEMVRAQRVVAAPFGDVALPTIAPDDIAEVAAVALREAGHGGNTYELTGRRRSHLGSRPRRSGPRWASRCGSSSRAVRRPGHRCCSSCTSGSWTPPSASWARRQPLSGG